VIYYMYNRETGHSLCDPIEISDVDDLIDKSAALRRCYGDAVVYHAGWHDGPEPAPSAALRGIVRAVLFALFCLDAFYTVTVGMACYTHHTRPDWHLWAWAAGALAAAVGVVRSNKVGRK
jgi:hypothetical protein